MCCCDNKNELQSPISFLDNNNLKQQKQDIKFQTLNPSIINGNTLKYTKTL